MFLDTFMDDASEGIMENPIPDLDDLQLDCAASLEAAYSDLMLEGCQVEFKSFCEDSSIEALNEGIFDVIKKFFRTIWNFLKKIFGIKGSGGSSGGGNNPTNTKEQKKEAEKLDKEIEEQKEEIEFMLDPKDETKKRKVVDKMKKKLDKTVQGKIAKVLEKDKKNDDQSEGLWSFDGSDKPSEDEERDKIRQQILDELRANRLKIMETKIYDPFVDVCPLSELFINELFMKMHELARTIRDTPNMDRNKFEDLQQSIEQEFLLAVCESINETVRGMKTYNRGNGGDLPWEMDIDDVPTVATVSSQYKKLTAPRKSVLTFIMSDMHSYKEFKDIIHSIRTNASDELRIDFQAILKSENKRIMSQVTNMHSYSNENIYSLIARIKMRLIADLSQIIATMGIENKKARFYQLNGIRNMLHLTRELDADLAKMNNEDYIQSEIRKRMQA